MSAFGGLRNEYMLSKEIYNQRLDIYRWTHADTCGVETQLFVKATSGH